MPITQLAFLGTGTMGAPMAMSLACKGFDVAVWNRSHERTLALRHPRLRVAETARLAVRDAQCTFVMLSTDQVVEQVVFDHGAGQAAVADAMLPGSLLVVMSSMSADTCRAHAARLARRGVDYVDAPVSGSARDASRGALAIWAGGKAQAVAKAAPALSAMGRCAHVGDVGAGQIAKLASQILFGATVAAVAEALHFVRTCGVDPRRFITAIEGGCADSAVLRRHGERMLTHDFVADGSAARHEQDLVTAHALAGAWGLELPMLAGTRAVFETLVAHGDGHLDHAAVIREITRRGPPCHLDA